MGIFADSITLTVSADSQLPIAVRLAFMIRLETESSDPAAFSFEFKIFLNGNDLAGFEGTAGKAGASGLVGMPLVANLLQLPFFTGAGKLSFHLRVKDQGEKELLSESLRPLTVVVQQ
jgi:hypothetical protein